MIILYILAGIITIAVIGWLCITIGAGMAAREEPPDEDI